MQRPRLRSVGTRSALILVALASFSATAAATIVPGGTLATSTWTAAGSPYDVLGDVRIPTGVTLTIDPGVTVRLATTDAMAAGLDVARVEIIVEGALAANGTSGSPVTFQSAGPPSTQAWYGLRVEPAATSCALTHVVMRHAQTSIRHRAGAGVLALSDVDLDDASIDLDRAGGGAFTIAGTLRASRVIGDLSVPTRLEHNGGPGGSINGNFALGPASTYACAVLGQFDSDRIFVTGTISLDGTLELNTSAMTLTPGQTVILMINDGTDPVSGTFANAPEGGVLPGPGSTAFFVSYVMGTGNDVGLTAFTVDAVPPGAALAPVARVSAVRPNPGRGDQSLDVVLPEGMTRARLEVLDVAGRLVWVTPLDASLSGARTVTWDGRHANGARAHAGLYLVRLRTDRGDAQGRLLRID